MVKTMLAIIVLIFIIGLGLASSSDFLDTRRQIKDNFLYDIVFQDPTFVAWIQTFAFDTFNVKNLTATNITVTDTLIVENLTVINNTVINTSDIIASSIKSDFYLTTGTAMFPFNFYDDGSEAFINFTGVTDAVNIETENSKLVLYNEPSAGNDFKVLQTFSKEAGDVTEFIVHKAGVGRSALFSRSVRIGGITNSTCDALTQDVDCDTSGTGADLVVQDEIWTGSNITISNSSIYKHNTTCRTTAEENGTAYNIIRVC